MGKRRDPRIQARLEVRIAGIDASGRPLLQLATTRNISRQGALLEGIQSLFKTDEVISISYKNNKARFRVAWMGSAGTDKAGQIGVQSVDPSKCIWDAATLPPSTDDTYAAKAKGTKAARARAMQIGSRAVHAGCERAGAGAFKEYQCRRMFRRYAHLTLGERRVEDRGLGERGQTNNS